MGRHGEGLAHGLSQMRGARSAQCVQRCLLLSDAFGYMLALPLTPILLILTSSPEAVLAGHDEGVTCIAEMEGQRAIATGGRDGQIIVWGWSDAKPRQRPEELNISPEERGEQGVTPMDAAGQRDSDSDVDSSLHTNVIEMGGLGVPMEGSDGAAAAQAAPC